MRVILCVLDRRQSWRRNSKLKNQVGSKEYRVLSSSMDVICCGLCNGTQVAPFMPTYSTSLGPSSITWNVMMYTKYSIGTSETSQSRLRDPVDQTMMLVESINSAFTRHCPPRSWCTTKYNWLIWYVIVWLPILRTIKLNWWVTTRGKPIPVQVWYNSILQRGDLKTNHEEADVISIHLLVIIAPGANDDSYIKVVCDDTDVFVTFISSKMWPDCQHEEPTCWENDHR